MECYGRRGPWAPWTRRVDNFSDLRRKNFSVGPRKMDYTTSDNFRHLLAPENIEFMCPLYFLIFSDGFEYFAGITITPGKRFHTSLRGI